MLKKIAFICCFLLLFALPAAADSLTASVDNTEVAEGETVLLKIAYDGNNGNTLHPDLSVLQNNYTVYSTSTSLQSNYINGQSMQKREWNVQLLPHGKGKQTIPSINVGQYKTQPIDINVVSAGTQPKLKKPQNRGGQAAKEAEFKIDLTVDNQKPYVQQQINAVLTVSDNRGITLQDMPEFSQTNDWVIKTLRQPTSDTKNGQREIKFYYALFPQKSGIVELPVAQINGFYTVYDEDDPVQQNVSGFFRLLDMDVKSMFGVQKKVVLKTDKATVNVKPVAAENGDNWWLPSSAVSLYSKWENQEPQFKVGETVARQFVLTAAGVAETQLPDIEFSETPNIKQYPESPQTETIVNNDIVYSRSTVRVVYIPQDSGMQTLPEVKVAWFDVAQNKMQYAVIPETKIKVIGGKEQIQTAAENIAAQVKTSEVEAEKHEKTETLPAGNNKNIELNHILLMFVAFCAGLLICFLLMRKNNRNDDEKRGISAYIAAISEDFKNVDYHRVRDDILAFAGKIFTNHQINNLNDVADCIDNPDFTREMENLNCILYAGKTTELNEKFIIDVLKKAAKKKKTSKMNKPLPDLYK